MIFEKGRLTHYEFYLNSFKQEFVTFFKYLGIYFFLYGHWYRTQNLFCITQSLSVCREIELPTSDKYKLFDVLVGSILNYGAEAWGMYEAKDVEMLHPKFCRWILHVKKSTKLSDMYGELGSSPLQIGRTVCMIRYWVKLLEAKDDFTPKKLYLMLKADVDNNRNYNGSNWTFQIKSSFDKIELSNIWIQQFENDIPFNPIKLKIYDIYKQTWYSSINISNILSLYARYKHEFHCENYLDFITEKK